MKLYVVLIALCTAVFASCTKEGSCPSSMHLTATTLTPTVGDDVVINSNVEDGPNLFFQWNGPFTNLHNQLTQLTLNNIKLSQSGKYTCALSATECNRSFGDSIIIDVQLKQETPPCTPVNNRMTSTNTPNATFVSVTQGFHGTWNAEYLEGTNFNGTELLVLFYSYNGHYEPKDGVYFTNGQNTFSLLDEPNTISLSFIASGTFYHSNPNQKVYVSHAGGKLQVTFCNITFYGVGGLGAGATTCSAKMTKL